MNDTVHVQVEVILLFAIRIGPPRVDGDFGLGAVATINLFGSLFDDGADDLGVLFTEPAEKRRDTHVGCLFLAQIMYMRWERRVNEVAVGVHCFG